MICSIEKLSDFRFFLSFSSMRFFFSRRFICWSLCLHSFYCYNHSVNFKIFFRFSAFYFSSFRSRSNFLFNCPKTLNCQSEFVLKFRNSLFQLVFGILFSSSLQRQRERPKKIYFPFVLFFSSVSFLMLRSQSCSASTFFNLANRLNGLWPSSIRTANTHSLKSKTNQKQFFFFCYFIWLHMLFR